MTNGTDSITPEPVALGSDFGYQPENYGFEQIGDVDWSDGCYQFDLTTVWKHKASGSFYMADDSGCSCPSPYEGVRSVVDLTPIGRLQTLIDHLNERNKDNYDGDRSGDIADLVQAYREARS